MTRDDRMMIRADAKAMGAVTAQSVRVSERWQPSTNHGSASPCISYFNRDKSDATIFRAARTTREHALKTKIDYRPSRIMAADLPALYVD